MLIRAAECSPAWLMLARIAMKRAIHHGRKRVFSDRKETHWGKRKLKRTNEARGGGDIRRNTVLAATV
jgi:hypothetical protein